MVGPLISEAVGSSTGGPALQLMAPAIEKAIEICLIAALPVGGSVGWLSGELMRRAIIRNKQGVKFHIFNTVMGTVGFIFGAWIGFQTGPKGSVLVFAILSSAVLVLVVRFCIYILTESPQMKKKKERHKRDL